MTMNILVIAVQPIPEPRQVKTTAEVQVAVIEKALTFEIYYTLLQSAAAQYNDTSNSIKQRDQTEIHYQDEEKN